MKGRAIYRWERDESAPSQQHRAALLAAFAAVRPELGEWFKSAMADAVDGPKETAVTAPASAPAPSGPEALERAVFTLADELDLPPRRVRAALRRFVARLLDAKVSLEAVQGALEEWIRRVE